MVSSSPLRWVVLGNASEPALAWGVMGAGGFGFVPPWRFEVLDRDFLVDFEGGRVFARFVP